MLPAILLLLVLRFDGSLRRPRDLVGLPTHNLGQVAAAAAAIGTSGNSILALGGCAHRPSRHESSAHAEYNGLLVGLRWLANQSNGWWQQLPLKERCKLTIQGDCKTVIDQLNGISEPRKLETKHTEATRLLNNIMNKTGIATISCERIPRDANALCDSVCSVFVYTTLLKAAMDAQSDVNHAIELYSSESSNEQTLEKDMERVLFLNHLGRGSLVPYVLRPHFYRETAMLMQSMGESLALIQLGELMQQEAKSWPSLKKQKDNNKESKETLTADAIRMQLCGLEILGRTREASKLQRIHKRVLQQFGDECMDNLSNQQSYFALALSMYQNCINGLSSEFPVTKLTNQAFHNIVELSDCFDSQLETWILPNECDAC